MQLHPIIFLTFAPKLHLNRNLGCKAFITIAFETRCMQARRVVEGVQGGSAPLAEII